MNRIELTCEPEIAVQLLCVRCGLSLNGPLKRKVKPAVKLFGLKAGYQLCGCGQTIFNPHGIAINWESDEWQQVLSIVVRRKSK
jgi:hypothetical protein